MIALKMIVSCIFELFTNFYKMIVEMIVTEWSWVFLSKIKRIWSWKWLRYKITNSQTLALGKRLGVTERDQSGVLQPPNAWIQSKKQSATQTQPLFRSWIWAQTKAKHAVWTSLRLTCLGLTRARFLLLKQQFCGRKQTLTNENWEKLVLYRISSNMVVNCHN